MDFLGRLREQKLVGYDYPTSKIISFVLNEFTGLSSIDKAERERLIGLGVGSPISFGTGWTA